jgi:hypothetical protein
MGCDIHTYVEALIDGEWIFLCELDLGRDYALFSVLANVRNYDGIECVSGDHKGFPESASDVVRDKYERWGDDGHSHSFLDLYEISDARILYEDEVEPGSWPEDLERLSKIQEIPYIEDTRIVFWFDN